MRKLSAAVALAASLLAGVAISDEAMSQTFGGRVAVAQAEAEGGRSYRRDDWRKEQRVRRLERLRNVIADCHRDVRTHRINGAPVTHRHVGDNCSVRIVRQATQPAPGG